MFTHYFGNLKNIEHPVVSISGRAPSWYSGPQYKVLAPKWSFFSAYKAGMLDEEGYTEAFHRLVLAPLSAKDVYSHLVNTYGENVTLLCYEKPGEFCHRRIVANWFEDKLGVTVPELTSGRKS